MILHTWRNVRRKSYKRTRAKSFVIKRKKWRHWPNCLHDQRWEYVSSRIQTIWCSFWFLCSLWKWSIINDTFLDECVSVLMCLLILLPKGNTITDFGQYSQSYCNMQALQLDWSQRSAARLKCVLCQLNCHSSVLYMLGNNISSVTQQRKRKTLSELHLIDHLTNIKVSEHWLKGIRHTRKNHKENDTACT